MIPYDSLLTPLALQAAGGNRSMLLAIVPWVLMFGIFYVLLILPQQKRQKALRQMIENLKKGDKVITTGGLYGEVAGTDGGDGGSLLLKIADNVKVKIAKSAIAGLEGDPAAGTAGDKGGNR